MGELLALDLTLNDGRKRNKLSSARDKPYLYY